ncbi:hypothetical protein GCM10009630_66170 [Kribbella jejuensis]|jgi:hypothetical protein|uniref:Camelysin-like metallo-endopeptidase n=1 Tax=Kribbella jejuensis TaxID=236068 RepID=A0A542EPE6_9ACTN|nr:hypothetical protein [Kribbella jejuensis]TQJ17086.1 hypothetical protein FB475_1198 [Kribbella jejuensis]
MHRKKKIIIAAAATLVIGAGSAFAYWSTTGSGTGTGATSAGASNLAIAQTSTISNMYPGDSAQTISGTVTNNASNSAYVNSVTVSIASVTQAQGATGTCDATDYTLANPTMSVASDVAAGATANFTGATIKFNNKASNQDGCKGATVNLAYASN